MTTLELVEYYEGLLILQYHSKQKAKATIATLVSPVLMPQTTVETITFSAAPDAGTFILSYGEDDSAAINWNDSVATVESKIQAIAAELAAVTVTGNISDALLTVTFTDVIPPAALLTVNTNTLTASSDPVDITITETDETLPLVVQDGFNLMGANVAIGAQLDILGKYAGVTRSGPGFTSQITLDDTDFLSLIKMAIIKNSAGSSLSVIQDFIAQFFSGFMLVFDYQNMQMSYLISSAIGSQDLVELFVTQGLLPKPMAVQVAVIIYAPVITTFFGFRTYISAAFNSTPFNSYADYQTDWPWLSYANAIGA